MIYCFDLDGTLCTNTDGDYKDASPFLDRIKKVNDLHDEGHKIIIESARGGTTNKYWVEFTRDQLESWGVKYHSLRTGWKITADIYIDDKAINDDDFFSE